jgi:hypothetical protein
MLRFFVKGFLGFCFFSLAFACSKTNSSSVAPIPPPLPSNTTLSYGDSIFYFTTQAADYIVSPINPIPGNYSVYPEGLDLNESTGEVNVSKSESGLKYRISFTPQGSQDSISTTILVSGINFLDGFYKLNTADSIARPIYNANASLSIPGVSNGTLFDESSKCNSNGCTVNVVNGQINLAQTVRNGVFGATPSNNDRHEFDLDYRINDKSNESFNTIRVKLYYFETMNDVTQEVYDIISSREGTIIDSKTAFISNYPFISVNSNTATNGFATKSAKPRPPCIFIVSR